MYNSVINNIGISINYITPGIGAHFLGCAAEGIVIYSFQQITYLNYIKIPVAKVVHELAEGFITSSPIINMYNNGNNLYEAVKDITKPILESPLKILFSTVLSYSVELIVSNIIGLKSCSHKPSLENNFYCQPINTVPINNCDHDFKNNIIMGIFSSVGSLLGSYLYDLYEEIYLTKNNFENSFQDMKYNNTLDHEEI